MISIDSRAQICSKIIYPPYTGCKKILYLATTCLKFGSSSLVNPVIPATAIILSTIWRKFWAPLAIDFFGKLPFSLVEEIAPKTQIDLLKQPFLSDKATSLTLTADWIRMLWSKLSDVAKGFAYQVRNIGNSRIC